MASTTTAQTVAYVEQQVEDAAKQVKRLLSVDELPAWMRQDPFILRGYRRELGSFRACFSSLFYLHNEWVNTWSHLAPAIAYLALLLLADYKTSRSSFEILDFYAIHFYVTGTATCLLLSALFHGSNAHSQDVARRFLKLDYFGIVVTISTTAISSTYFGLRGNAQLQSIYISFTVLCATAVFRAVLSPTADGGQAAAWRALVFIMLALSGFAPMMHVAFNEGASGLSRFPLQSVSITCTSYLVGTLVYVARFPEKHWPGVFDIWGSSHQVFHVLVAFGQLVHLLGLTRLATHNAGVFKWMTA